MAAKKTNGLLKEAQAFEKSTQEKAQGVLKGIAEVASLFAQDREKAKKTMPKFTKARMRPYPALPTPRPVSVYQSSGSIAERAARNKSLGFGSAAYLAKVRGKIPVIPRETRRAYDFSEYAQEHMSPRHPQYGSLGDPFPSLARRQGSQ